LITNITLKGTQKQTENNTQDKLVSWKHRVTCNMDNLNNKEATSEEIANTVIGIMLHSLYSSPNIVRVIKSKRMRWVGHVARMGRGRSGVVQGFGWEALREETTGKT
jgi:hypothetical protein